MEFVALFLVRTGFDLGVEVVCFSLMLESCCG
jgi:hypothetical protein